jgi:hypothetical protein
MLTIEEIIEKLCLELPPVFTRKTAEAKLGRIISARTLANLDSLKKGPPHKYLSNTVVYERETFLQWLRDRLSDTEGKPL